MSDAAEVRALIAEALSFADYAESIELCEPKDPALKLIRRLADALESAHAEPDEETYTQSEYLAAIRAARYDIAQMHPGRGCIGCHWCTHVTMLEGAADALSGFRRSARVPVSRDELAASAKDHVHKRHPERHDNGVGIVQGSHYRAGFVAGAEWVASDHDIYPKADRKPADSSNGDDRA